MLRVLGRVNSINVQKVLWTASELKLPLQQDDYGGAFGGLDTTAYTALNPNKLIPVLVDGNFSLWESNSIMRYLGEKYSADNACGGLWPRDAKSKANVDKFLDWQISTLYPPVRTIFLSLVRTPESERNHLELDMAQQVAWDKFQILEYVLSDGRPFVAGGDFTLADIALGITAHRWLLLSDINDSSKHKLVEKWYQRLCARQPFQKHILDSPLS